MNRTLKNMLGGLVLSCLFSAPSLALGPVDGEFGAIWWANDFETAGVSTDAGAPAFRAELWLKRYGLRAGMYSSDLGDVNANDSEHTSVDFMWKAFAPTENNFLAVGLGWQETDLTGIGLDGDTSGMRVSVEGRVGIVGAVYAYGHGSYLPALDDTAAATPGSRFEDMEGIEYEAGVSWKAAPFVSLRAAYRDTSVDYKQVVGFTPVASSTAESSGFLLGLGFHF